MRAVPQAPARVARQVWLFGGLQIAHNGRPMMLRGAKLQALFAFLALHAAVPQSRDALANHLWPEAAPERVRRFLSDALYRLRQSLGEGWLEISGDQVRLQTGADLWVDVWAFEQLIGSNSLDDTQAAIELYQGELLPECFDDWLLVRRAALHERFTHGLFRLGASAEAHGALDRAVVAYRRLIQADPLDEGAHRSLMRVYARSGRYRQALRQYEELCSLLTAELHSEPLPETVALAATLRDEAAVVQPPGGAPRLVGRQPERAMLLAQVDRALQGHGSLICIAGEPGIGKTRLLESLAEGAAWRGLEVHWGRAREHEARSAFAPLDEALQAALTDRRLDQLREHLSPVAAAALSSLVPALRPTASLQLSNPPNLATAFRHCLHALTAETPQLLILDDVQWAGPEFWALALQFAHLQTVPLLVVLAYRPAEARTNPLVWRGLCDLDSSITPVHLELIGLTPADCLTFARDLGHALNEAEATALHAATAGNPFHLSELLLTPGTNPGDGAFLSRLIQQRLAALRTDEHAALEVAAVLGREFTDRMWRLAGGQAVHDALPRLIGARLVEETATGYRFQHDLVREEVYAALSPLRRRELHAEILALLEPQAPPALCAWHARQAERWPEAAHWCRLAGEHALAAYAYEEARRFFEQALACAEHGDLAAAERLTLHSAHMHALKLTGPMPALRAAINLVEELAVATERPDMQLAALEARIGVLSLDSQPALLEATVGTALALAAELGERSAEARIRRTYGLHLLLTSAAQPHEALPELEQAVRLAESARDYHTLVGALCTLGFGQRLLGRSTAAHASASQALALAEMRPELYPARADALRVLAEVALNRAEWELARATLQTAIAILEELNDRWPLAIAYFMATSIGYAMGQHAEAHAYATKLQALVRAGEVAANSHWMLYVHTCAIDAAVHAGDLAAAERIARDAQGLVEQPGDVQATIYLLTALGSLRLFQNRYREACAYLERAVGLWQSAPSGMLTPMLLHATAAHLLGQRAAAEASLGLAEHGIAGSDILYYNVSLSFTRFLVRGSSDDLRAAHNELQRQAALFRDESRRTAFRHDVRLHRIVERLWQFRPLAGAVRNAAGIWTQLTALYQPQAQALATPRTMRVPLARTDAPLGRALAAAEQVLVSWTIDAGAADALVLQQHGKATLRRHRLRRLLDEAAAQGAAPTDADLAAALGVSRRTILRDMADLTEQGNPPATRRRRA